MNYAEQLIRDGNLLNKEPRTSKPKKPLPKRSHKRSKEETIYRAMLPGWLRAHPKCAIGPAFHAAGIMVKCRVRTTHPHHVRGRIGKLLYDERYMLPSCDGECHPQAVHFTHPKEARALGLLS